MRDKTNPHKTQVTDVTTTAYGDTLSVDVTVKRGLFTDIDIIQGEPNAMDVPEDIRMALLKWLGADESR